MGVGLLWLLIAVGAVWAAAYFALPGWGWVALLALPAALLPGLGLTSVVFATGLYALLLALLLPLLIPPLRRALISQRVLSAFRRVLPEVSRTEQEALDAGTVWWDGDLFRGRPDWGRLLDLAAPGLSEEEQAFLDGPVDELCSRIDDWRVTQDFKDLPPEVWEYLKENGFFGMIIPKRYGGRALRCSPAHPTVPSGPRDTRRRRDVFHPSAGCPPTLRESSASWHAPANNRPPPAVRARCRRWPNPRSRHR